MLEKTGSCFITKVLENVHLGPDVVISMIVRVISNSTLKELLFDQGMKIERTDHGIREEKNSTFIVKH